MDREDKRRYLVVGSVFMEVITQRVENNYSPKFNSLQDYLNDKQTLHTMFHLRHKNVFCCTDNRSCQNRRSLPLTYAQWDLMYTENPHPGNHLCHCVFVANPVTLDDLDVTLATLILLNCGKFTPQILAVIKQLRTFKNNYLSHNTKGRIRESEFDTLWTDLETYVLKLDPSKQDDLIRIKNRPLDEDLCNKYITCLLHVHEKLEEISAKLDTTKTELLQKMDTILQIIPYSSKMSSENGQVNPFKLGQNIFTFHRQIDLSPEVRQPIELLFLSDISDIVMLDDGKAVMCVPDQFRLLICDTEGSQVDSIHVQGIPWSATAVNSHAVAVTLFDSDYMLEIYDINEKNRLKSFRIPEKNQCSYITTIDTKLVISGDNALLIMDAQTGQVVQTIHTDCQPCKLHADSDRIYCCGYYPDFNLYCYSTTGDKLFTTTLPYSPSSITTLKDGSLYVVCNGGSVQHVSSDGKRYKSVNTEHFNNKFDCISCNERQKKLITLSENGDTYILRVFHQK